jgi:hypothetical protein
VYTNVVYWGLLVQARGGAVLASCTGDGSAGTGSGWCCPSVVYWGWLCWYRQWVVLSWRHVLAMALVNACLRLSSSSFPSAHVYVRYKLDI